VNILKYVGSGETSDKVINLAGTTGGATLDQSGTGNMKFNSPMTATALGAKGVTLQGSTSGTGELAGAISDLGGNVLSLTKNGSGTWMLSGANSYSGITTLADTGGILRLMSPASLSANTTLVGSGSQTAIATLDLAVAGNYVANSYGNSGKGGANMLFSASSGSDTTLTFTNAANFISVTSNAQRYITNNSVNLRVIFNGTFDIGSSLDGEIGVGGAGSFIFSNSITSSGTGIRGLVKGGNGSVILNASNSYNGPTTISAGILSLGASGALGTNSVILNGGTLRADVKGTNVSNGNLNLSNTSTIDLGTFNTGVLRFTTATSNSWSASSTLWVTNSSGGAKLYITSTNNVALSQIKSAENTNATASLDANGLLTFSFGNTVADGYALYLTNNGLSSTTPFNAATANGTQVGLVYAFGSASGMPQSNGVTAVPVMNGNQLTYVFDVKDDSALTITYQTSSDLVTWTTPVAVSAGTGTTPAGFLKKQVQVNGSGKLFVRINVTRP
jgi:autotransporter-associated beta strand protein